MRGLTRYVCFAVASLGLSVTGHADETQYSASEVRAVYADACGAHGIDPPRCDCVVNGLLENHSVDAIMANGFGMTLQDEKAVAISDRVGEQAVWAASDAFDLLQNTTCSSAAIEANSNADGTSEASSMAAESAAMASEQTGSDTPEDR